MRTNRPIWLTPLFLAAAVSLSGCSGGGGALGLSGGSVPLGGRVVTGVAVLPDGTPAANAKVALKSLPAGIVVETSTTDSSGRFSLPSVPTDNDVSIVVTQPPTTNMEAVVPQSDLAANPGQPLDVGNVTALTTVVAAAIHLEHGPAPEDAGSIVMNQKGHLTQEVHDAGYSVQTQMQLIGDPNSLTAQALTLIVPTANTELAAYAAAPGPDTAASALNGILGYVRAAHKRALHLSKSTQKALINAQLAGTVYSAATVATALKAGGVQNATDIEVTAASEREHSQLTALGDPTNGISAFEALIIAADVNTNGGFELNQNNLNRFLKALLNQ